MKRVYVCQDNITSLLSALYYAWKERRESGDAQIAFRGKVETEFFCEYVETTASEEKALAVQKLIEKHLGMEAYKMLYFAALSDDAEKGNAIWGTMVAARNIEDSTKIMQHLTEPSVRKAFELYRKVSNESHFFKEILRFRELKNGILFAKIEPKSQVLTTLAPHFANRLPLENFMIYDETHQMFVIHEEKKNWVLVSGAGVDFEGLDSYSEAELEIERLWKGFFHSIAIKERESHERQRQHFPIWYRKNAVEFQYGFE